MGSAEKLANVSRRIETRVWSVSGDVFDSRIQCSGEEEDRWRKDLPRAVRQGGGSSGVKSL